MGFYDDLAAEKSGGSSDGDYILADQTGVILLHGVINKTTGLKKTVILVGEIVKAQAKVQGGPVQAAGTKVKKIYSLSKFEFHLKMLKTDLVNITGLDEKEVTPKQTAELFQGCFESDGLKGVLCSFSSFSVKREGKPNIDKVVFGHMSEKQGNSDEEIAKRAAEIESPK
jgi:hypothetical protein